MNVYLYDEITKEYISTEEALLDPLETEMAGKPVYLLPANATFVEPPVDKEGFKRKWNGIAWEYEEIPKPPEPTLDELKVTKINAAGAEFAKRRDAVRFVDLPSGKNYGFDCAPEDITNFMAAYTPLMIDKSGSTGYKVWLNQTDKGLVVIDYADMNFTYNTVRNSQLEAYNWYETIKAQIKAVKSKEELDKITLL